MKLKQLCDKCNVPYNSKNPKRSLNKIRKEYMINEVSPRNYIIERPLTNDEKYKNSFYISHDLENRSGIYKIYLDKTIYIGQTSNFKNRYYGHRTKTQFSLKAGTYDLLRNGGKMEIIELQDDLGARLEREQLYIDLYTKLGYNVLNTDISFYKNIKINMFDYKNAIKLLKDNNIEVLDEY